MCEKKTTELTRSFGKNTSCQEWVRIHHLRKQKKNMCEKKHRINAKFWQKYIMPRMGSSPSSVEAEEKYTRKKYNISAAVEVNNNKF